MTAFVGVDVGGTKRAAVLIDGSGTTLATGWAEHQGEWQGRIVDSVASSIEALLADAGTGLADVEAIGVAVAGLVASDRSTLVHSPIIRETHVRLGAQLTARTGRPVTVDNDANATLYATAARDRRPAAARVGPAPVRLLLTLGTGLGGAVMIDDRILAGEHGFAAELGHVIVDPADDRRCVCGSRGCVEQYASGRGLDELAAATTCPAASREAMSALGISAPVSARDLVRLAERGDLWAGDLLTMAGTMLGRALAMLCVTLDPTTVTIAGTLGHAASPWLLPAAEAEMRERWAYPEDRPLPHLAVDPIGPFAAATGAALLAADSVDEERPDA